MKLLTSKAALFCAHETGKVLLLATQRFVTIRGRPILVHGNPSQKPIAGCSNIGLTIKPCLLTQMVEEGYSDFLSIDGKAVCLDTVTGKTDGTPPGLVSYKVRSAGQGFVEASS